MQSIRIMLIAITVLSGAVFLSVPGVAWADAGPCTLAKGQVAPKKGVRLLAGQPSGDALRADCHEGDLVAITARIAPGSVAQARAFWAAPSGASLTIAPTDARDVNWLSARQLEGQLVSLRWQAPEGQPPGGVRSALVRFGDREVEVHLEVVAAGNLFRDGFDVDPVIGQFSMVLPTR